MVTKTFSIATWQNEALKKLSEAGVNGSQVVRMGIKYILKQLSVERKTIPELIEEYNRTPIPVEKDKLSEINLSEDKEFLTLPIYIPVGDVEKGK